MVLSVGSVAVQVHDEGAPAGALPLEPGHEPVDPAVRLLQRDRAAGAVDELRPHFATGRQRISQWDRTNTIENPNTASGTRHQLRSPYNENLGWNVGVDSLFFGKS